MAAKLKIEKRGENLKKIFSSETTEPISIGAILVEGPNHLTYFLEKNHPMTISSTFSSY
jgi:hypothetical protein